jgi:tRNA U34 5-methylaminomethyl-2-thiouridine-forming methyltransferase MnmC
MRSIGMISISERYRLKALACEQFSLDATDCAIKTAWTEIAIEWHALSNRVARVYDQDQV